MTRRIIFIFAVLAAAIIARAQETNHYRLDVKDFTQLKVTDGINVDYCCNPDSAGMAVFDATDEMSQLIIFDARKDKLTIQLSTRENIPRGLPTVRVYSRYLAEVENDGDSLLRVLTIAPGPKLKVKLLGNGRISVRDLQFNTLTASMYAGNGTITLAGTVQNATYNLFGKGSITADMVAANVVKCHISAGTIGCNAAETLTVIGAGGRVFYSGNPTIKNKALGVKIEKLQQ